MLQRIQTVFLLLASACMLIASVTPLVVFSHAQGLFTFEAMGINEVNNQQINTWGLFAIGGISSIMALITVFLYKKRILQIRLSVFNLFVMIGFYLYLGFLIYFTNQIVPISFKTIGFGGIMPIIAIIFTYLAIRKIGADETLVRSLNRLRG